MDKVEYQQRLEELTACVEARDFTGAKAIADKIDWRRVKSVKTLNMVADIYEHEKEFEKTKDILTIAHTRTSIGRGVLARLVEVCLKLGQVEQAEKYFREFSKVAQNDSSRYVLQYELYKAKQAPLEAQIAVLEEYREKEYTERWAYELAELYSRAGEQEKCIEACDDLILWFSEGKYVLKAMELKKQFEPLSEKQQVLYTRERDAENERARAEAAARAAEEAAAKEAAEKAAAEEAARREAEAAEKAAAEAAAAKEAEEREKAAEEARKAAESFAQPVEEVSTDFPKATTAAGFETTAAAAPTPDGTAGVKTPSVETPTVSVPDTDLPRAEAPTAGPEDLKNRLLRTFQSMFGSGKQQEEKPAEKAPEVEPIEEEPEGELVVRELISEEEIMRETSPTVPTTTAVPATEEAPEAELNLDELLQETAESFSEEIGTGKYEGTTEETPARLDEEKRTAEEEAALESESATAVSEGSGPMTAVETIQVALDGSEAPTEEAAKEDAAADEPAAEEPMAEEAAASATEPESAAEAPTKKTPHYIEELEVPDEEPTAEEKKSRTIPLGTIGQNTVPISIDKILSEESPEEQRIRILNKARPTRMNEEQRKIFTYFARIPGMDSQILEALSGVYEHAGERTSLHGNIGVMGARGTGKTRLSEGLVVTMCKDLDLDTVKIARIRGTDLNEKDPARVVSIMSGGFLIVEDVSTINEETLEKLNQAMEFRTDCMVVIIEDEKSAMRAFLKNNPTFAAKFEKLISIPVFTNDELVTFARTYAAENDCQLDDLGILALYTKIGNMQTEEKPVTISEVRDLVDGAMEKASKGRRRSRWGRDARKETARMTILHEKDFE